MPTSNDTNLPLWLAFLAINEQATRDWLTGLHNRRYFEETLVNHIEAANRYKRELSLVLFDIDHFKKINDTQGHEAGDQTLQHFSALLKKSARKADIICRYGGDEFVVLLPETPRANAQRFIDRVNDALKSSTEKMMTVTAGIAALPCENLLSTADTDLLAKKRESQQ